MVFNNHQCQQFVMSGSEHAWLCAQRYVRAWLSHLVHTKLNSSYLMLYHPTDWLQCLWVVGKSICCGNRHLNTINFEPDSMTSPPQWRQVDNGGKITSLNYRLTGSFVGCNAVKTHKWFSWTILKVLPTLHGSGSPGLFVHKRCVNNVLASIRTSLTHLRHVAQRHWFRG